MKYPRTASEAAGRMDLRNREKLERSPGSYFRGRARELVLAAPYFRDRLRTNSYGGTATAHFHNLCAASYVAMLSAFEVMWKALFAGVVNATDLYDENIVDHSRLRDVVTTEGVLAHRDEASAGGVIAGSLGTWQRSDTVNENFKAAFKVEPIAKSEASSTDQLWQIRHVVAHGSGVIGALDSYRLKGAIASGEALVIDRDYLEFAEGQLKRAADNGVARVAAKILKDFFSQRSTGSWAEDAEEFSSLFLLGVLVGPRQELPDVSEDDYDNSRADLA